MPGGKKPVNRAASHQKQGGNQNPEANAKRRFHIHASTLRRRAQDSATVASLEDCASAMPGIVAGPPGRSTFKIRPGCSPGAWLPFRAGQPLIASVVSDFSIHCLV